MDGYFNNAMAVSDVFLLRSLLTSPLKAGISALTKSYSSWSSWKSFYGKEGFAAASEQLHHWAWARHGQVSGSGFSWWLKNQKWNLLPMKGSRLFNLTGAQVHTLLHGKTVRALGLTWSDSMLGEALKIHYGTSLWFKTTINYSVEQGLNKARKE